MNRLLKLLMFAAVAEMVAVHAGVVAARHVSLSTLADLSSYERRVVFALAFFPPWIAGAYVAHRWLLAAEPSGKHRTSKDLGMIGAIAFNVGCHNLLALSLVQAPLIHVPLMTLVWMAAGVLTMVYGNYRPRIEPPIRPGAASPGQWARTSLRNGWAMVLLGAAEIVCAVVLSGKPQMLALLLMAPMVLAIAISEWRLVRPATPRPA